MIRAIAPGLAGLAVLVLLWQAVHRTAGPFVLPAPAETVRVLVTMLGTADAWTLAGRTAASAVAGLTVSVLIGTGLGIAAGVFRPLGAALGPAMTVLLGVPPIAWVVLVLLWFGDSGAGAAVVVMVATLPLVHGAAVQGVRTLDPMLLEMAQVCMAPPGAVLWEVRVPHLATHLAPALTAAHAIAWKATVMAEVLGAGAGIGAALSTARANLDLARVMALVVLAAGLMLVVETLVLRPVQRRLDSWRGPA